VIIAGSGHIPQGLLTEIDANEIGSLCGTLHNGNRPRSADDIATGTANANDRARTC
jgi:hypothetical protein